MIWIPRLRVSDAGAPALARKLAGEGFRYLRIDGAGAFSDLLAELDELEAGIELALESPSAATVARALGEGADRMIGLRSAEEPRARLAEFARQFGTRFVPGFVVPERGAAAPRDFCAGLSALAEIGFSAVSLLARSSEGREASWDLAWLGEVAEAAPVPLILAGDLRCDEAVQLANGSGNVDAIALDPEEARRARRARS